ncbi:MAG: peptidylprolyl isomerase [Bacteroidota bacterium]
MMGRARRWGRGLAWAGLLSVLGASSVHAQSEALLDTLAVVDDHVISTDWFEQTYVRRLLRTGQNDTPTQRTLHLDQLVDEALLAREAERRGLTQDSTFQAVLARTYRSELADQFFSEAFVQTLPPLTEDEVRRGFVRSKEQRVVRHLFYQQASEAQAAYARLKAGEDFMDEAQRCYNLTAYDSAAGYLGPIRYFNVDPAFAEAAWELERGAFSEPVRSRFWFHIIRVEDQLRAPLLTESEFQTRREGLSSQLRLHRRQLEGDRFIQSLMTDRAVQAEEAAIAGLSLIIEEMENRVERPVATPLLGEQPSVSVNDLRAALDLTTVLATYDDLDGTRQPFTVRDYLFWLPDLPFEEARHRTAASVGRALRNEVLAEAGAATDLDEAAVATEVSQSMQQHLARRLRAQLRETEAAPPEAYLRQAFDRMGYASRRDAVADGWVVVTGTRAEAEALQRTLAERPEDASRQANYQPLQAVLTRTLDTWGPYVSQAPVGDVVLVSGPEAWAVLQVTRRTAQPVTFETYRDELTTSLGPLYPEYELLKALRQEAAITVDVQRFEELMTLEPSSEAP